MKKKTLLLATVFAATSTFAQDLTSKKGEPFLPEAGDWAIQWDAAPVLDYFGQLLSNAGSTSPVMGSASGTPFAIRGKMFKDEKTAYRAGLRIGLGNSSWTSQIATANQTTPPSFPALSPMVEDEYKAGTTDIVLSGGLEMRRGKTRLQGYYGGEVMIGFSSTKDSYTYGNTLVGGTTPVTVNPNTTNFGSNITTDSYGNTARVTESKTSWFGFGLRGFIGAEYFIFPKIAVGAEYGWGVGMWSAKSSESIESVGTDSGGNQAVGTQDTEGTKMGGFALDADINNGFFGGTGNLTLTLHF